MPQEREVTIAAQRRPKLIWDPGGNDRGSNPTRLMSRRGGP